MRKLFLYGIMLLAGSFALQACGDDEEQEVRQAPMTMFRISEITGMSFPDDSLEVHAVGNSIQLNWFAVEGCAGYEIMYAQQEKMLQDSLAWANPANIEGRFTVSAEKADTTLQNLQYATSYLFAIRVLSNQGEQYHSEWFGIGSNHHWANICLRTTEEQPETEAEEEPAIEEMKNAEPTTDL